MKESLEPLSPEHEFIIVVSTIIIVLTLLTWGSRWFGEPEPPEPKIILLSEEVRSYEVVSINPPKHFSVDLLDVQTHRLYKAESWSKHCFNWRKNKLHDIVDIKTSYYKYEGSEEVFVVLENINHHFCK